MGKNLIGKVFTLGVILAVLCMGLFMVNGLVHDRQQYRETVVDGFAKGLAGRQKIVTPTLHMQCKDTWRERGVDISYPQEETYDTQAIADEAQLKTRAVIEPRTRGIYQVNTFQLKNTMEAAWTKPVFVRTGAVESKAGRTTTCQGAILHLAMGDPRGIRDYVVKVNGQTFLTEPYVGIGGEKGLRLRLGQMDIKGNDDLKIDITFGLVGIESLELVPRAAKNAITVAGNWSHPSFTGTLPDKRAVTERQFEATWDVPNATEGSIHVGFVDPVNAYTQTDRAVKYGLLFIVLTFVAVGLFEVTKKLQVHPVQYLLVGSAVTIFFLLLLSLSEHLSFPFAYVLAATACVGLLTFYASHILGGLLRGTPFGGLMTVLYGMIYVLLSLEQTALLIGTLALFATLTAVMVLTRKINWYDIGRAELGKG